MADYARLEKIAKQMVQKPKGILAMDESTSTMGKRLEAVGLQNTEENRRDFREAIISSKGLGEYVSGAILYEETLYQKTAAGKQFVEILKEQGILPGIKVDKGLKLLANSETEQVTEGLDGLRERLAAFRQQGAEFAKWRAVISIGDNTPTNALIEAAAHRLAEYAALCQEQGLVPIVEPEVLMEGNHDISKCAAATTEILKAVFSKLKAMQVNLKGIVLKPNMICPGNASDAPAAEEVAKKTLEVLKATVPAEVPGIAFLSGGIGDEEVTQCLNEMNKQSNGLPWNLTFSFGRGLVREPLQIFASGKEKTAEAQEALLRRAKESSEATQGKYAATVTH